MVDDSVLLDTLRRFAHTMSEDYDVTDVLFRLTEDVAEVLGIAGAGIVLTNQDGRLQFAAASSDDVTSLERTQEEHQMGPCAESFRSQMVVTVADIASRPDWPEYRKEAERLGFSSVAGVPVTVRSERLGALNLYDRVVREWTDGEVEAALVLVDVAAGYLLHERLQDSRQLTEQLQTALDSRILIEQAKGILSAELSLSIDEAFEVLRRESRNNNTSLRTVSQSVVEDGFRPSCEPASGGSR
jgi:GAF domain-containing protein